MYNRLLTGLLVCPLLVAPHALAAAFPPKPNIILVLSDDQGYGDLGCTGNPVLKTPAIDQFYRQSARFTDFQVSPTCAPTRSALLTGRHEFKNGVTHTILERERLAPSAVTLAQVLKSAGYRTGIFGKWHLGDEPAYQPDKRGFDEVFIHGGGGIGQTYPGSCGDAPDNKYWEPVILHNGKFEKTATYCTEVFFQQAVKWIDEQRKGPAPFFAYVALNAPHEPLVCPERHEQLYSSKVGTNLAKFYGMIASIDDNFRNLLATLKTWNLETNTLVIFMTDNGGTVGVKKFNAGMRGGKGTAYNGATHVPSFWRWPAAWRGGRDINALAAHIDVLPTLAEIAGAELTPELKQQIEGRSLVSLLKNAQAEWPDRLLFTHVGRWPRGKVVHYRYQACGIRNARFRLVSPAHTNDFLSPTFELYDLEADPGETRDVAGRYPKVVAMMRTAYEKWWDEIQPCLVNENARGPKINPFKALYYRQFGGQPSPQLLKQMDPDATPLR